MFFPHSLLHNKQFRYLGAFYTPEMVRLEIQAVTDAGLTNGWAVWNPNNKYRKEIFLPELSTVDDK